MKQIAPRVVSEGKFVRLLIKGGWEYVERPNCAGAVIIVAMTKDRKLLLIEQFRIPVGKPVIEFPAGLIGDGPSGNPAIAPRPSAVGGMVVQHPMGGRDVAPIGAEFPVPPPFLLSQESRGVGLHERLAGTLACIAWAMQQQVHIVRVHDVKPVVQFITMWRAVEGTLVTKMGY